MKRIKEACICQTIHFSMKEDANRQWAERQVQMEVENYKKGLERNHTKYKIIEESTLEDGSVIIKIMKQYNTAPVGSYFDMLG